VPLSRKYYGDRLCSQGINDDLCGVRVLDSSKLPNLTHRGGQERLTSSRS